MIKQIIREPLVHFIVLGGLLFWAWSFVAPPEAEVGNDNAIVVDQRQLDHLETLWKAQWQRDPAPDDVAAIIDRHLRQEVFYREALKMGLDRDDDIIRTRLAQKMEAVASDLSTLMKPPSEAQLREFYQQRADLFTLPQSLAFKQVLYLPAETDEASLSQQLASLNAGADIQSDRINKLGVANEWPLTPALALDNAFGGNFAASLASLPVGQWAGSIRSGLGLHLVLITQNEPQQLAPFDEIHDFVAQQYQYYAVIDAQKQMFQELVNKYRVQISASGVPDTVVREYSGQ